MFESAKVVFWGFNAETRHVSLRAQTAFAARRGERQESPRGRRGRCVSSRGRGRSGAGWTARSKIHHLETKTRRVPASAESGDRETTTHRLIGLEESAAAERPSNPGDPGPERRVGRRRVPSLVVAPAREGVDVRLNAVAKAVRVVRREHRVILEEDVRANKDEPVCLDPLASSQFDCFVDLASGATLACDYAIVAVPLGVLQSRADASAVRFDPPLGDRKQAAIAAMGMGTENKVVMRFAHAFWKDDEWRGGGAAAAAEARGARNAL